MVEMATMLFATLQLKIGGKNSGAQKTFSVHQKLAIFPGAYFLIKILCLCWNIGMPKGERWNRLRQNKTFLRIDGSSHSRMYIPMANAARKIEVPI
jgi:hypothetical protein